jgi:hypothetical protein
VSLRRRYMAILTHLAPAGVVGLSAALGAVAPAAASEPPDAVRPSVSGKEAVAERLAAVRDAISAIDGDRVDAAKAESRLAWGNWGGGWGWRGGWRGGGWPNWNNWPNWHNWGNFWHNW